MDQKSPPIALLLVLGCKPDYLEPPDTLVTEGFGDTGDSTDTEGSDPKVCYPEDAPAEAVRWQCEGFAEAVVRFAPSEEAVIPN